MYDLLYNKTTKLYGGSPMSWLISDRSRNMKPWLHRLVAIGPIFWLNSYTVGSVEAASIFIYVKDFTFNVLFWVIQPEIVTKA